MDWKQEAAEQLRSYKARKQALSCMTLELSALGPEDEARHQALQAARDRTAIQVALVERGLDALTPEERRILELFYIEPVKGRVEWLCEELECEQASVYRRRNRALRNFTLRMYGGCG